MRRAAVTILLLCGVSRCGSCKSSEPSDGGSSLVDAQAPIATAASAALSLPLAADHDRGGNVYVAGFVAAHGALNVSRFDEHGTLAWNVDAFDKLTYSSDAHVDVIGATKGAVVVWRGLREGKRTRVARYVGDDGKAAASFPVGSSACTVSDTLFTISGKGSGAVTARRIPDGDDQTILTIPDGEPTLVCGDGKRALLVEEGEDDITVHAIENGKALPRVRLLGPDDLGDDDFREHEDFTTGDVLGEMVLTEKGRLMLRQYRDAKVDIKRTLDHIVGADEDLVAVDGTTTHVVALLSREAGSRCDGDVGTDVLAVDVPLPDKERVVEVAHGECGRDLGPYWVAATGDAIFGAWAVRGPRMGGRAPVEALAWARLDEPAKTISLAAEDVVFAGCHTGRCAFVALQRPEGTDGMVPGEARVITIP